MKFTILYQTSPNTAAKGVKVSKQALNQDLATLIKHGYLIVGVV